MLSDSSKHLRRLRMLYSLHDLQLALSAADFLSECDPGGTYSKIELRQFKCFETTMIVSYARPFTQSPGGVPALSLKMTGAKLDPDKRSLHDRIMKLRNKAFAHSDPELMRMAVASDEIEVGNGKTLPIFFTSFDEGVEFIGVKNLQVIDLIRNVLTSLHLQLYGQVRDDRSGFDFKHDHLDVEG